MRPHTSCRSGLAHHDPGENARARSDGAPGWPDRAGARPGPRASRAPRGFDELDPRLDAIDERGEARAARRDGRPRRDRRAVRGAPPGPDRVRPLPASRARRRRDRRQSPGSSRPPGNAICPDHGSPSACGALDEQHLGAGRRIVEHDGDRSATPATEALCGDWPRARSECPRALTTAVIRAAAGAPRCA